ncbi:MAG: YeeE/YedE family protein [Verrucomicrobiae bacterium]|nr:YeeE/YedE family protein [Verrucomicrobiae bacterium]
MEIDWVPAGGLTAGALAGFAARYGRLCTMGAIEDAIIGRDLRRLRAWGLALAVAAGITFALERGGIVDLSGAGFAAPRLHLPGLLLGGLMFGLGMSLVGTCSFGLLVRVGGGDLRAAVTSLVVGVFAIAATAGALVGPRERILAFGSIDLSNTGGVRLTEMVAWATGPSSSIIVMSLLVALPVVFAVADRKMWRRPRLVSAAIVMGFAIGAAWYGSWQAVQTMGLTRPEGLSFVAPTGRALLQFMTDSLRGVGFGVWAMVGVVLAALATAQVRKDFRWEAFDDAFEMRRHLVGGALMGTGGVLAGGCTIGQGLTASSITAISAPLFLAMVFVGAYVGLRHLLVGRTV